jgi:cytochrome P450
LDAERSSIDELLPHLDLYDPEQHKHIWEILAHARQSECPIFKTDADAGYFVITRYDDAREIANDPDLFSSIEPALRGTPVRMPPVSEDPPIHKDFRKILNPYFSRTYLSRYSDDMRATARELLAPVLSRSSNGMEFMHEFALPYTATNLARVILGETDKDRIRRASEAALRISSAGDQQAFVDLTNIAAEFMEDRLRSGLDHDDVLSAIVNGSVLDRPLTLEEKVGTVMTLFSGGLDTVRGALGNIVNQLANDPTIEERLRNADWMRGDIDEFLRLETPIQYLARTVTRDTAVNGCPMKAGDRIALHFAAANRDPSYFDEPDELRFDRESNPHMAFGIGIHRCLGLHFARLQIEVGIEEFLSAVTNVRIPDGVEVELSSGVILTPENLPIEFDAHAA